MINVRSLLRWKRWVDICISLQIVPKSRSAVTIYMNRSGKDYGTDNQPHPVTLTPYLSVDLSTVILKKNSENSKETVNRFIKNCVFPPNSLQPIPCMQVSNSSGQRSECAVPLMGWPFSVIFCTTNSSPVLARERSQIMEILGTITIFNEHPVLHQNALSIIFS